MLKGDLKTVFSSVIRAMGSTLGACGDVNRNVCGTPGPYTNRPEYEYSSKARARAMPPALPAMPPDPASSQASHAPHTDGPADASPSFVLCYRVRGQAAEDIADLLAPQSGAYYDVWLDGEKFMSSAMEVRVEQPCRDD